MNPHFSILRVFKYSSEYLNWPNLSLPYSDMLTEFIVYDTGENRKILFLSRDKCGVGNAGHWVHNKKSDHDSQCFES